MPLCGHSGGLIIGVDLQKSREILEAAYNDSAGVTAPFNLNMLVRANRELGADFDLRSGGIAPSTIERPGRIEMHLSASEANRSSRRTMISFRARRKNHHGIFLQAHASKVSARWPPRPVSALRASGPIHRSYSPSFIFVL